MDGEGGKAGRAKGNCRVWPEMGNPLKECFGRGEKDFVFGYVRFQVDSRQPGGNGR